MTKKQIAIAIIAANHRTTPNAIAEKIEQGDTTLARLIWHMTRVAKAQLLERLTADK